MIQIKSIILAMLFAITSMAVYSQQLGLNFNHNPENIDFKYVNKVHPDWIRTTPRILDYVDGQLSVQNNPGIKKIIRAGKQGYKIVFGFRWDFKKRQLLLPAPGSAREIRYFKMVDSILEKVGPYVRLFALGNEPNLETMESDLQYNQRHEVPLIIFTNRLMQHVLKFYKQHSGWELPKLYAGSLPALFEHAQQQKPGVFELIKFAQKNKEISGLAIHLHIEDTLEIAEAFKFVRSLMPHKPIIVPEFSLFRLYNKHFKDSIGSSPSGAEFLQKYHLSPDLKVYQWLTMANNKQVPYTEWADMFTSQSWYLPHYLWAYYRYFTQNGVILATYPLLQQGYSKRVTPKTPSWFLNPLFIQKTFGKNNNGDYYTNPLVYQDFMQLLEIGKSSLE